jgi:hypothetical protein
LRYYPLFGEFWTKCLLQYLAELDDRFFRISCPHLGKEVGFSGIPSFISAILLKAD